MTEAKRFARKEFLQPSEFQGIFIPTVTPFKRSMRGICLDLPSLKKHIAFLANPSSQAGGLFLGSNARQGRDMPISMLKTSIEHGLNTAREVNPDLPIVAGALRNEFNEVIDVAKFAEQIGADAVVIAPGFIKDAPSDLLPKIISKTRLPIIIYNNPGFQNKKNLSIEFIREAAENPQVIGIKDSSSDEEYFRNVLNIFHSKGKKVMQGSTKEGLKKNILEADGMVPVEANIYPRILAGVLDKSHEYRYPHDLEKILQLISPIKAEFGGTAGYVVHRLFKEGVFERNLTYPKKNG